MKYIDWNNRFASHFFNEEMEGREVILNVTKDLIEIVGSPDEGMESFLTCIHEGPDWVTRDGLCMKAYQSFEDWRRRELQFPPYLAYLCLFVLSNDIEGDFNPNAYYPRLNKLLGQPEDAGAPASYHKMWELWMDLEEWSTDDKNSELGVFIARMRGKMAHIGFPLSQTVLKREDRDRIPLLFNDVGLEPGQSLPPEVLLGKLRPRAARFLSARTARLLKANMSNLALQSAFLQMLQEELLGWDGHVQAAPSDEGIQISRFPVHLCLKVEGFGDVVTTYVRHQIRSSLPNPFYFFNAEDRSEGFSSEESSIANWSTRISKLDEAGPWVADNINWKSGLRFVDETAGWKGEIREANVRLFVRGRPNYFLPEDWVESHQNIQRSTEFAVACEPSISHEIKSWIEANCTQLRSPTVLDNGWSLYFGKDVTASFETESVLTLSSDARITLKGGFKKGRGTIYFSFGLPTIALENAVADDVELFREGSNEISLQETGDGANTWVIPTVPPLEERLQIKAFKDGDEIALRKKASIRVISERELPFPDFFPPGLDSFGMSVKALTDNLVVTGATSSEPRNEEWFGPSLLPLHLGVTSVLIGRLIGQVREFPKDEVPEEWDPIWVLSKRSRNHWIVSFCGRDLAARPVAGHLPLGKQKLWKKYIWIDRKHHDLSPLRVLRVRRLWGSYERAAKNV